MTRPRKDYDPIRAELEGSVAVPCAWCWRPSTLLCDGRVEGGTCDAPICSSCSTRVASGIACSRGRGRDKGCKPFTVDHCPFCAARAGVVLARDEHDRRRKAHAEGEVEA